MTPAARAQLAPSLPAAKGRRRPSSVGSRQVYARSHLPDDCLFQGLSRNSAEGRAGRLRYTAGPPVATPLALPTALPKRRAAVLLAAAIAALLALGARWSLAVSPDGRQLRPRPDALEYVAAAQSIAQNGTYFLQIGDVQVRPRYPPGWPLILAGALRLGVPPEALWRVSGLFAAAQSALVALAAGLLCARMAGERDRWARLAPAAAALLAGAAWALAPAAVEVGRTAVSDQPAVFLASLSLLATGAWIAGSRSRAWPLALLGGLAFGAACGVRPIQAFAIAPGIAALLVYGWRRRVTASTALAWGLGAAVFPLIVIALLSRSGIPIANWSDYRLWVPQRFAGATPTFSLAHAVHGNEELTPGIAGARASHLEIGLRVLTGLPGLQEHHYLGRVWPLLGWFCLFVLLGRFARGHPGVATAAWTVGLVTLAHLVIFSSYFYPAGRFYLLVLVAPIVALAAAIGWLLSAPRWRIVAVAAMLFWPALAAAQFQDFRSGPRTNWPDEPTRTAFRRWVRWSDQTRSQRVIPFDPVHGQALGLFRPAVVGRIRDWGLLPESQHVRRLRASGVLDYQSFRIDRKVTGYEPPAPPAE